MAIEEKFRNHSPEESLLDLARQYGKNITTDQYLEDVSNCFNWEFILEIIKTTSQKA